MRRFALAFGLVVALGATSGAALARGPDGGAPITASASADERVISEALTAFQAGSYAALTPRLDAIRAVLEHAPADSRSDAYPTAALMLGAYAVENRRFEEAVTVMDRGLAFQPDSVGLLMERGQALLGLRRPADALGSFEAALSSSRMDGGAGRSRALRSRGVALIDLQRLDEAETSLNASLALDPGNAATLGELQYIRQLRAGATTRPTQVLPNGRRTPQPGERAT